MLSLVTGCEFAPSPNFRHFFHLAIAIGLSLFVLSLVTGCGVALSPNFRQFFGFSYRFGHFFFVLSLVTGCCVRPLPLLDTLLDLASDVAPFLFWLIGYS